MGEKLEELERVLRERGQRWEAQLSFGVAAACLVGALVNLTLTSPLGSRVVTVNVALYAVHALYFVLSGLLFLRGVRAWTRWASWLNVTLEASFATWVLLSIGLEKGSEWALTGVAFLIYAAALVFAASRMRPALCAYATLLILGELAILYLVVLEPRLPAGAIPTAAPWAMMARMVTLAAIGVFSTVATRTTGRVWQAAVREELAHLRVDAQFGRFVSRDVARAVLRGDAASGPVRCEVTVLFCDVRNFTALCEREDPAKVVALLNLFYARACACVEEAGGTVNKFFGDGLLALFGAPDPHPDPAAAAITAARRIVEATDTLRAQGAVPESFDVGIGIDAGPVVVGEVGSPERVEWTAIGSTVNRAARLQGLARGPGNRIVLSAACAAHLGSRGAAPLGAVTLKGFSAEEPVYALDVAR